MKRLTLIPKKIHYIWVGNKPKPPFVLECIATWKKFLPDYEIIEWSNECLDSIKNTYAIEAYKNEKWAFVSDYIRLHALYHHGGIYLDTDVEVTKEFDNLLSLDFFSCHEVFNGKTLPITSAVLGASKGNGIIKDLLDTYENKKFIIKNTFDLTPNTLLITEFLVKKFNISQPFLSDNTIHLREKEIIFPSNYFCERIDNKTNYSIHHFSGSWLLSHSRKDKLKIFNRLIVSRLKKKSDKGEFPILSNEKLLFSVKLTNKISYLLLLRAP
ncbi:glycosyltransferase [Citrobacter sp. wls710]|uniref:glycosyltransferase family 32 protein n=1 Tax=Citrobacter sp. wls710 TaxID=2576426 RepID=UPI002078A295|nr:glycosyltransferase [Citrobacter sp. wls710]